MEQRTRIASLVVALLLAMPSCAKQTDGHLLAVDAFDQAVVSGDEARVRELLAPDVLIYESGGQEASLAEYAASHLKADMEFMAKVQGTVIDRKHGVAGEFAWVATRRRMTGSYADKPIDVYSTETMVLRKEPAGWRIAHIHWSSRPVQPKKQ
jgi:ketosteroid isomerase-like protein